MAKRRLIYSKIFSKGGEISVLQKTKEDMRMKRKLLIVGLCLILAVSMSMASCQKKAPEKKATEEKADVKKEVSKKASLEGKPPYVIGAVVSVTGDYSGLGEPEKKTLELEVKKINDNGGVNGFPVKVIVEDDATDPTKAVAATTKLIGTDKVIALIGATGTGQTMAMRPEVEKAMIPQVSMAGGSVITDPINKWVFATPWPNRVVVVQVVKYLKSQNITEVATLSDSGAFGKDGKAVLEKQFADAGIKIVDAEEFGATDLDMKAQLTKIKGTTAKAVVVWAAGKAPAIIAKEMKELQMTIPYIGSHGIARNEFIQGAVEAAEGVVLPAGKVLVPEAYGNSASGKAAKAFIADYTKAYKEAPNGTFPGHAYDALYIITDALKRLGDAPDSVDPSKLRDAIEETSKLGLIGGEFNYSVTDHAGTVSDDIIMLKIQDGKFTWLKM